MKVKLYTATFITIVGVFILGSFDRQNTAHAAPVVGFNAGRIIDDAVFTANSSMNTGQIQNFLNSKVPVCDTWGTQPSEFGGGTRAQWGAANGKPAPFICLKDYTENGKPSAQIIYEAAQEFRINPQVLIVLLQKEQGLVTDTWPLPGQYRTATGYGCPDTAPCDTQYFGLTNQLRWSGRMFRAIMDSSPTWYTPYVLGNNFIRWNPASSCGSSTVYIENRSTQALYNYTPYRPNQAALNAGYGMGDSCSAYGNRNFYQYFKDWFGSTTIYDPFGWNLIKTADDDRVYLVIGNTKRWIPSGEIFNDWNLGGKTVETVSQPYLDSVPTIPPLDRLGYYNGKYYYVDGGKKYWLSNDALIRAWGQSDKLSIAAPAYVPLSGIPDGGEATFYVALPSESKVARLINGQRYMINAADADRWHANPIILTSSSFNSTTVVATLDYHVSVNGIKYLVDDGKLLNINSTSMLRDYSQTGSTFVNMPADVLNYLPVKNVNQLVAIAGGWYVLRDGNRYYIPTANHAYAWNIRGNPTVISAKLATELPPSPTGVLPLVARDSSNGKIYLMDGEKHELVGTMLDVIKTDAVEPPSFTSNFFAELATSDTISTPIIKSRELGNLYTFDNGSLYHIPSGNVLNGLGYPRKYSIAGVSRIFTDASAANVKPMSMFIKIGSTTYFLQDGNLFPITTNALSDWTNGSTIPIFSSQNLNLRFDIQASNQLDNFIQEGNDKYVISSGVALKASGYTTAYLPSGYSWKSISIFGLPRSSISSAVAKSNNTSDGRIFSISNGTKQHILTGESLSSFTKQGVIGVTSISPTLINLYSQVNGGSDPSPLTYADGQGFKLLSTAGTFFGFSNSDTLINFANGNPLTRLDSASYSKYSQQIGSVTRLIRDQSGKIYWVENGMKRWITSGSALQPYSGVPVTNVSWNTVNWLPDGNPIL